MEHNKSVFVASFVYTHRNLCLSFLVQGGIACSPRGVPFWLVFVLEGGEGPRGAGEGDDRGWNGWMASLTRWTWIWTSSGSWWWTGKPGLLQFMGSQRVRHDWVTELNWGWRSRYSNVTDFPLPKKERMRKMELCRKFLVFAWMSFASVQNSKAFISQTSMLDSCHLGTAGIWPWI